MTSANATAPEPHFNQRPSPGNRSSNAMEATTPRTITAANGRYMRCSQTRSSSGTKLEVGERIRKNHTPTKPSAGRRLHAKAVISSSPPTRINAGQASVIALVTGQADR
jgi:hypothetical protein